MSSESFATSFFEEHERDTMEGETRLTEGGDEGGWQKEEVDEKKEEDRADACPLYF